MTLYTSSWATKFDPQKYQRIGISRGTPRNFPSGYRLYKALAPGSWFRHVSVSVYRERFFEQLAQLNPQGVIDCLHAMCDKGQDPVIVCYESPLRPDEWCHRGMVSAWLHDELQLEVKELTLQNEGFGWSHPKLPVSMRRPPQIDISPYLGVARVFDGVEWEVVGVDETHPDQGVVRSRDGERRTVSKDILEKYFGVSPELF